MNDTGPRPPVHYNCRCTTVPVLRSLRELGFDIDEPLTDEERASMDGQVPGKLTYEQWLGQQSPERRMEALGPARAKLFNQGRRVGDFVTRDLRPATLAQIRAADARATRVVSSGVALGKLDKGVKTAIGDLITRGGDSLRDAVFDADQLTSANRRLVDTIASPGAGAAARQAALRELRDGLSDLTQPIELALDQAKALIDDLAKKQRDLTAALREIDAPTHQFLAADDLLALDRIDDDVFMRAADVVYGSPTPAAFKKSMRADFQAWSTRAGGGQAHLLAKQLEQLELAFRELGHPEISARMMRDALLHHSDELAQGTARAKKAAIRGGIRYGVDVGEEVFGSPYLPQTAIRRARTELRQVAEEEINEVTSLRFKEALSRANGKNRMGDALHELVEQTKDKVSRAAIVEQQAAGDVTSTVRQTMHLMKEAHKDLFDSPRFKDLGIVQVDRPVRAYANFDRNTIVIGNSDPVTSLAHEFGHHIEFNNPNIHIRNTIWRHQRVSGTGDAALGELHGEMVFNLRGIEDDSLRYIGRVYDDQRVRSIAQELRDADAVDELLDLTAGEMQDWTEVTSVLSEYMAGAKVQIRLDQEDELLPLLWATLRGY